MMQTPLDIQKKIDNDFVHIKLHPNNFTFFGPRSSILNAIREFIPEMKGDLLDVGCGIMPYRSIITENKKVSKYVGMDLAQPTYYAHAEPDLKWDGNVIPSEDASFDCLLATEFFEHYHDTQHILKEMNRVLKNGGTLFGTVPFIWNLHEIPYDEYRFTPFSLQKHFEKAGFTNIEIKPMSGANKAFAQMLGMWFEFGRFRAKRFLKYPVYWFYKWLIRTDKIGNKFDGESNSLYNGLSFKAVKS